jgi:KH/beta-lactamase-domain protein
MLGGARQVGRSCILLQTPNTKILIDCGMNPAVKGRERFPYLDISEFKLNEIDAIILSHAHLDHSALIPYLFKMGYRGPVYMTAPTRDLTAILTLDFIGVAYKQAASPLFSSVDIKEMVKHTICLDFNEVTDIAPDIRITFYNSGHCLGSAITHINIGNGAHNLVYSGDIKYVTTRLLDRAVSNFPRMETLILESTYGGKNNILPPRIESEKQLINEIKNTIEKGGKVLIPELGLGRAQETMLILEEAIRNDKMPKIPIYIDGMIWDINGIHTAYPDFLHSQIKKDIFANNNPFVSEIFNRVGSAAERKNVIEGGPCVVLATSGMLVGGASVEYFRHFASNKNNKMCFVCYQGAGSLGKQVQDGMKQVNMNIEGRDEIVEVNLEVVTIDGLSAHAGRNELIEYSNRTQPKANKIILNHGEQSRCLDLASSIYKLHHIETNVPKNLETIRLR